MCECVSLHVGLFWCFLSALGYRLTACLLVVACDRPGSLALSSGTIISLLLRLLKVCSLNTHSLTQQCSIQTVYWGSFGAGAAPSRVRGLVIFFFFFFF